MTVLAIDKWKTNGDLIAACADLGYLRDDWVTLDPTYGEGTFWKVWQPGILVGTDINPEKRNHHHCQPVDFTALPWLANTFDCVVFDPPYKLNGTPDAALDERYGVDQPTRWQDRMDLIARGLVECDRVYNGVGYLLLKVQDQVCSGKIRWQSYEFTKQAEALGLGLVDRFDFLSYRPQPADRCQVHARRNSSQLLVFKRGW